MDKILVCNTKINLTTDNVGIFVNGIQDINSKNLIICPSVIYTPFFAKKKYALCAQYFSINTDGNHTGEVSIDQVKGLGSTYSLIGHFDLRDQEDSSLINSKIKLSIKNGITPIVCIGESLEEKKMLKTERVIKKQIISYLREISLQDVIIAYNPGFNLTVRDKDDVQEIINFIRSIIDLNYKCDTIRVICGDINDKNIKAYSELKNIDGFITSSIDVSCIKNILEVISK